MKKMCLLLICVLSFTLSSYSQSEDSQTENKKSESMTVAFMDKYGKLLEVTRFGIGKVSGIKFDVVFLKNILDGSKIGCLRLTTSTSSTEYYGYLDYDEIDNCIQSLIYFKDNVLPTELDEGADYKEVTYRTRDYVEFGVYYENWPSKSWVPYLMTNSFINSSKESFKSKDFDKVIAFLNQSKKMIMENLK